MSAVSVITPLSKSATTFFKNIEKRLNTALELAGQHFDVDHPTTLQPSELGDLIRDSFADSGWKKASAEAGEFADSVVNSVGNIVWNSLDSALFNLFRDLFPAACGVYN